MSIQEWKPDSSFGSSINQKTVFLTVRMFDLWETALADVFSSELKLHGISVVPTHDAVGDLTFVFPDGNKSVWEVKTTQGINSFTGATHSASKCNNYILISYLIDQELRLNAKNNPGFIRELAIFVWENMSAKWRGEPSKKSSWTTLKLPAETPKINPEIIVVGKLEPKTKWCKITREKVTP